MATGSWSPVRMRAATEESAVEQALMIVGAERTEISVEVIERTEKGVTVRIRPRVDDEAQDVAEPSAPAQAASEPQLEEQVAQAAEEVAEAQAEAAPFAADDAPSLEQVMEDEAALEPVLFEDESEPQVLSEVLEGAFEGASEDAASTFEASSAVSPEARARALEFAQEMLDRMGLDALASLSSRPFSAIEEGDPDAESRVYVAIEGSDVSILIGKHGATLQSFQYLLNLCLNNRGTESGATGDEAVRVVVDAGGYRSKRAEMLERMAFDAAARAKREGRAIRMESMPAHERRLVHMALRRDSTVSSGSEGREPQRFVVVAPAGFGSSSQGEDTGRYAFQEERGYNRGGYGGRGGGRRGRR